MSKCDERFARQYRYEPPPGFPLASPSSDIVHHLSGPNRCAYTQTSLRKLKSVVTTKIITVTFTTHIPFHGTYSHTCVDSLVRVSRRDGKSHFDKIALGPSGHRTPGQHRRHCCLLHRLWNSATPSCLSTLLKHPY